MPEDHRRAEQGKTAPSATGLRRHLTGGGAQILAVAVGIAVMILAVAIVALAEFLVTHHAAPRAGGP